MIVYPAVELLGGRCANLRAVSGAEPLIFNADPVATARDMVDRGAAWLHVSDLDAMADQGDNAALIREILRVAHGKVQVMGGVRSMAAVEAWAEAGAARIVIRAGALIEPEFVRAACRAYPDQIGLAIDVKDGFVFDPRGETATAYDPIEFASSFENIALSALILTDLDSDPEHGREGALGFTSELARSVGTPVISRGLVGALDDVARLKYTYNIAGVVIGRALMQGAFTIEEALEAATPPTETTPPFIVSPLDVPPDQRP